MDWKDRIEVNPTELVGKPFIKGTRISVELILYRLADLPPHFAPPPRGENHAGVAAAGGRHHRRHPRHARFRQAAASGQRCALQGVFAERHLPAAGFISAGKMKSLQDELFSDAG